MDEEGSTTSSKLILAVDAVLSLDADARERLGYSDQITNCAEQVKKQCSGRYSSDNPLKVTILGSRWGTFFLDSSLLSQALAIQLAKPPQVKVTFLVPENSCSESDKREAVGYGVTIVEAKEQPGFDEPTDWLYVPPQDLTTDIVVGAGERLGKIAEVFKQYQQCKNIYVVSDPWEEWWKRITNAQRVIEENHTYNIMRIETNTVGISEMADLTLAPGPKISDNLSASLRGQKKDVFKLTPGILSQFCDVEHAIAEQTKFRVLILGGGNPDNFEEEGLNTAAEAVAELKDKSYHLLYVGAAKGDHERFAKKFHQCGVSKNQLTIRSFPKSKKELKSLFCEVDLAIMPSSEQGFGMKGLAALSSGLPVLVHEDSGFGEALKEVNFGTSSTVDSEDASVWAKAIKRVRKTERKLRLQEAASLRSHYDEKYSWEKQCRDLVQRMVTMLTAYSTKQSGSLLNSLPSLPFGSAVPKEILARGDRAVAAFKEAMEKGSVPVYRGRIMLLGQDRAGKTSLKKSLLGIPFDPEEESTIGIQVDPTKCEVEIDQVKNWRCIKQKYFDVSEFCEDIAKITARHLKDLEQERNDPSRSHDIIILSTMEEGAESLEQSTIDESAQEQDTSAGLADDVIKMAVQYLQGLKLDDDIKPNCKEFSLSVWDFAGQHLYYTSHSVFLSHRALYVLVHNLSKDLSAQAEHCARHGNRDIILENPTKQTNLDNLLSWLVSVHCIRPTTHEASSEDNLPYLRPPVFIVGTHADNPLENIEETKKCIEESILGNTYVQHVIRPLFAVDNTGSLTDFGVQSLQNSIMEVLKQEPYMGEKIPIRWFHFEKVIEALVARDTYYMDIDKLLPITKQVCHIDEEDELSTMLNFYHDLGMIVKHGRTVVLQAQWLIDLFKQLITVRPFEEMNPLYSQCWQELKGKGILRMDLVDHVFAGFTQKGLSKRDILNMMELYGLIAKFPFLQADGELQQEYFVPAQLRSLPLGLYEMKPSNSDPCALYLHFLDGFVPNGLFAQLVSRCIVWCSGCSPEIPDLYQNGAMFFFIGKQRIFDLVLICRKSFIKIILTRNPQALAPSATYSATKAHEVRVFFEGKLKGMSRELSWLGNLRYELCVECTHCLKSSEPCSRHGSVRCADDDCLCTRLIQLRPEEQLTCRKNYRRERIKICGLEKWLLVHENESEERKVVHGKEEPAVVRKTKSLGSSTKGPLPTRPAVKRKRERPELTRCAAKQRRESPCTSLKRPQLSPGRPVNLAGSAMKRKRESPGSSSKRPKLTLKDGTPENDDLEGLALKIVEEWEKLGRRLLENNEAELYAIDRENEKLSEKAYRMLIKWKAAKGSDATFEVLHDALCHRLVNRRDLAEKYCLVNDDI